MTTRSLAIQSLRDATVRFVEQCRRASAAQWGFRPTPGAWSMGDVAEHVAIANQNILRRLAPSLAADPLQGRSPDVIDEEIPYLFYRGDEPPNVATPTGAWTSWAAAEAGFRDGAAALARWADEASLDLRAHGAAHPVFGLMDGLQRLLFAAAHTERHRAQLIALAREAAR